jgi:hypothetical protein
MNLSALFTLHNLYILITDVVLVCGGYCFGYARGRWRFDRELEYWVAKGERAEVVVRKLRDKIDFLRAEIESWQRRARSLEDAITAATSPPAVYTPDPADLGKVIKPSPLKLVPAAPGVTIIDTRTGAQLPEPPPGTEVIKKEFLSTLVPKEKP